MRQVMGRKLLWASIRASQPTRAPRLRRWPSACTPASPPRNTTILRLPSAFPANAADEYYWSDLIGLEVKNRDGLSFGRVENLLDLGPHQVLRVTGGEREVLIPFVAQYVDAVDVAAKLITVDWGVDY